MSDAAPTQPIVVSRAMPRPLRVALVTIGVGICLLVVWELGRALWPPSFLTLFFGTIILGGWSVGGVAVLVGFYAPEERWSIRAGHLTVERAWGARRLQDEIPFAGISAMSVEESDGDGPTNYLLVATLHQPIDPLPPEMTVGRILYGWIRRKRDATGRRITSPPFSTRQAAERAMALLQSSPA